MANELRTSDFKAYGHIDETLVEDMITDVFSPRDKHAPIYFSKRGPGTATITLQFKPITDTDWTTEETYNENGRYVIASGGADVQWRAVCFQSDYDSGIVDFGFDW